MKVILSALLSGTLLTATTVNSLSAVPKEKVITRTQKYTCVFSASNPYPDGTTGVAYIGVKTTGKGTTVVSVGYFSDNGINYLGAYEEINGSFVPSNADEACLFAYENYDKRQ